MDKKTKIKEKNKKGVGSKLFRIGVLVFCSISFLNTASGLKSYVFGDNSAYAYLLSLVFQAVIAVVSLKNREIKECYQRWKEENPEESKPYEPHKYQYNENGEMTKPNNMEEKKKFPRIRNFADRLRKCAVWFLETRFVRFVRRWVGAPFSWCMKRVSFMTLPLIVALSFSIYFDYIYIVNSTYKVMEDNEILAGVTSEFTRIKDELPSEIVDKYAEYYNAVYDRITALEPYVQDIGSSDEPGNWEKYWEREGGETGKYKLSDKAYIGDETELAKKILSLKKYNAIKESKIEEDIIESKNALIEAGIEEGEVPEYKKAFGQDAINEYMLQIYNAVVYYDPDQLNEKEISNIRGLIDNVEKHLRLIIKLERYYKEEADKLDGYELNADIPAKDGTVVKVDENYIKSIEEYAKKEYKDTSVFENNEIPYGKRRIDSWFVWKQGLMRDDRNEWLDENIPQEEVSLFTELSDIRVQRCIEALADIELYKIRLESLETDARYNLRLLTNKIDAPEILNMDEINTITSYISQALFSTENSGQNNSLASDEEETEGAERVEAQESETAGAVPPAETTEEQLTEETTNDAGQVNSTNDVAQNKPETKFEIYKELRTLLTYYVPLKNINYLLTNIEFSSKEAADKKKAEDEEKNRKKKKEKDKEEEPQNQTDGAKNTAEDNADNNISETEKETGKTEEKRFDRDLSKSSIDALIQYLANLPDDLDQGFDQADIKVKDKQPNGNATAGQSETEGDQDEITVAIADLVKLEDRYLNEKNPMVKALDYLFKKEYETGTGDIGIEQNKVLAYFAVFFAAAVDLLSLMLGFVLFIWGKEYEDKNRGGQPYLDLNNGTRMPQLGIGISLPDGDEARMACLAALMRGYRHIDTAHAYQNERSIGKAIRESEVSRSEIWLTSKLWLNEYGEGKTLEAIDKMLERLDAVYIDLLMLHFPIGDYKGAWKDMEKAVIMGKVRAIGLCNFDENSFKEICEDSRIKPAVLRIENHPFFIQESLIKATEEYGVAISAWYPEEYDWKNLLKEELFTDLAKKYGKTSRQILLRWQLQSGYAAVPKPYDLVDVREDFDIFDFELEDDEMTSIDMLDEGQRLYKLTTAQFNAYISWTPAD